MFGAVMVQDIWEKNTKMKFKEKKKKEKKLEKSFCSGTFIYLQMDFKLQNNI